MELNLPSKLQKAMEREASDAQLTLHAHLVRKLERMTPPVEYIRIDRLHNGLPRLVALLNQIPSVQVISQDVTPEAYWWIKFNIDIQNHLAWHVVQALGFIFNEISMTERLPTVFKPTSPPPYLNGGPDESLAWVIESTFNYIDPTNIADTLQSRLPEPLDDEDQWTCNDA